MKNGRELIQNKNRLSEKRHKLFQVSDHKPIGPFQVCPALLKNVVQRRWALVLVPMWMAFWSAKCKRRLREQSRGLKIFARW